MKERWSRIKRHLPTVPVSDPLTKHLAIRHIGFCDEPMASDYRTFADDFVWDFSQSVDRKALLRWAQCKDVFIDFFGSAYKRYAISVARRLLSDDTCRPATLHVRDMDDLRFSVARFDGKEKILTDDLNLFKQEEGRVIAC